LNSLLDCTAARLKHVYINSEQQQKVLFYYHAEFSDTGHITSGESDVILSTEAAVAILWG